MTVVPFELEQHDRVQLALRKSGHSVNATAEYFGVSRNTVGGWTSGRINPSVQTLRLWAIWTGVPFSWLQTGEAPQPDDPGEGLDAPPSGLEPETCRFTAQVADQVVSRNVFPLPGRSIAATVVADVKCLTLAGAA